MNGIDPLIQEEYSSLEGGIYLNAASLAPLPERSRRAVDRFNERRTRVHRMTDSDFVDPPANARAACARLIGAAPDEIALGGNTSFGINLAALGLPVPPGSTVLASAGEFPANLYPWMRSTTYRLEVVPLGADGLPDEDRFLERLSVGDVRVVTISSVQFQSGFRADLDRLGTACREADAFLVVDAIQSLGCIPIDVSRTPVDVLAAGGHKWLCAPFGTGFAYVRREIQSLLDPPWVGWTGMMAAQDLTAVTNYEWGFLPDARKYELGTLPLHDLEGLSASLDLLDEVGIPAIEAHVEALLSPLRDWVETTPEVERLTSPDPGRNSGIFSFRLPDPAQVVRRLKRAGVVCALREGGIRVSPHLYNRPEEIGKFLEVLDDLAHGGWP